MQIVESSVLGLRTARISFRSATNPIEVTLFPMVHVGERGFYDAVLTDAGAHDVILVEGMKSPITTRITRSYRWLLGSKRIGLVLQPRLSEVCPAHGEVVLADLTHEEFLPAWRRVPLWLRIALYLVAPLVGIHRRFFATRETLAKGLSLDDAKSREEVLNWTPEGGFLDRAILDARDDRLVHRLAEQLGPAGSRAARIAVVYGAQHMRSVIRALINQHDYRPTESEWRTVFSL